MIRFECFRNGRAQSIPFQDVDCTIEGREVDLGAAEIIKRSEQTIAEFRMPEMMSLSGRRELRLGVHFALVGRSAEIEGIAGRKADSDIAAVIFQKVISIGQELAVKKDIALGGLRVNVIAAQINQPEAAADRRNVKMAGPTNALEGTTHGLDGKIPPRLLQINARGNCFDIHVAKHIGNGDRAGIIVNLKFSV